MSPRRWNGLRGPCEIESVRPGGRCPELGSIVIEHGTAYPSGRGTLALVCPRHAEELELELRARRWPPAADRAAASSTGAR